MNMILCPGMSNEEKARSCEIEGIIFEVLKEHGVTARPILFSSKTESERRFILQVSGIEHELLDLSANEYMQLDEEAIEYRLSNNLTS
ncbi:MAG: hypothetical protein R3C09_19850 [Pirellulaceae bacterium]